MRSVARLSRTIDSTHRMLVASPCGMAGHKLASGVLVDHGASLIRQGMAQSLAIPPLPPHCISRAIGAVAQKGERPRISSQAPNVSRELPFIQYKSGSCCRRTVYLVNPSRHPPEYRLIHKQGQPLWDAVLSPNLSSTATAPRALTLPVTQDLMTLISVSMPYRRASLTMEHLVPMKQPAPIPHGPIPGHILPVPILSVPIHSSAGTVLSHVQCDSTPVCYFSPGPSPCPTPTPLDRPTPGQLSFILLRLREEVEMIAKLSN